MLKSPFLLTAGEFPVRRAELVELDAEMTANECFALLVKNNLLSAPVYDARAKRYLGFLDIIDLVAFATHLLALLQQRGGAHKIGELMSAKKTEEKDHEKNNDWFPLPPAASMREVVRLLATKTRRVPIVDPASGRVVKIISQSLISTTLSELLHHVPDAEHKDDPQVAAIRAKFASTPSTAGSFSLKPVHSVTEEATAQEAFETLVKHNHSAVAITDDEGKLLTCVTAKDIRLLPLVESEDHRPEELLKMNVVEFVSATRLHYEKRGKSRPAAAVATLDTPYQQIVFRLAKTGMHRLFVVDDEHKLKGIFSVGDVVKMLNEIV